MPVELLVHTNIREKQIYFYKMKFPKSYKRNEKTTITHENKISFERKHVINNQNVFTQMQQST